MTVTERKRARSPSQPVGRWIRPEKRLAIYLRDGFRCLLCDRDLHGADPRDITLDHVVCRAAGGGNGEGNVYTCCLACNSARSDRRLSAYAGPSGVAHVRRHTRRALGRYRALAGALLGEHTWDEVLSCSDAREMARG